MRIIPIIAALALCACSAASQSSAKPERPSAYVRVIDGDTLQVRGETIRISNIDAPELPPKAKCWGEGALAVQAAKAVQEFVNVSPAFRLERSGKDRYGRTLARVILNRDDDLGEALVSAGLASKWNGRRWDWCGAPAFADPNGPGFLHGATGNKGFTDWALTNAAAREDRR